MELLNDNVFIHFIYDEYLKSSIGGSPIETVNYLIKLLQINDLTSYHKKFNNIETDNIYNELITLLGQSKSLFYLSDNESKISSMINQKKNLGYKEKEKDENIYDDKISKEMDNLFNNYTDKVLEAIEENNRNIIMLLSGYIGKPGHCIGLIIKKVSANEYNVTIINTGGGSHYHGYVSDNVNNTNNPKTYGILTIKTNLERLKRFLYMTALAESV